MDTYNTEQRYEEFCRIHGEPVWRAWHAYFPDGSQIEGGAIDYCFRQPHHDAAQRQQDIITYWKFLLEDRKLQFWSYRAELERKVDLGETTNEDFGKLENLRRVVEDAEAKIEELLHPTPLDASELDKARRLLQAMHTARQDRLKAEYEQYKHRFAKFPENIRRQVEAEYRSDLFERQRLTQENKLREIQI